MCVDDIAVPIFLVGGSAYPLLPWLIKHLPCRHHLQSSRKPSTIEYAEGVLWWRLHLDDLKLDGGDF